VGSRAPLYRPAARVLLLDEAGRVLLFRTNFRERPLWITPGGGLEDSESFEEAARRELWEETGIEAPLGPCVWLRRHVFEFGDVLLDEDERFFVARLPVGAAVSTANFMAHEHAFMLEHRWWTVGEIGGSRDWFAPRQLAALLPPIAAGEYPAEPIDCGV